jgi:lipopolysaccharide biosynthesis protein
MKLAILVHIGTYELWGRMCDYISLFKNQYDLWLTISQKNEPIDNLINDIKNRFPTANVIIVQNRGLDIGGFLYALKEIFNQNIQYDYVLKLHTKTDKRWSDLMTIPLLTNYSLVERIFKCTRDIGIVSVKRYIQNDNGLINRHHLGNIIKQFNMERNNLRWTFPAGAVFWIRFDLLRHVFYNQIDWVLANLNDEKTFDTNWMKLNNENNIGNLLWNKPNNKHYIRDGMIEHALERFFGYSIYYNNYKIFGI